ncbi:MAG: phosphotransferase [Jatrophihabitantaceae bacterium]
MTPATSGAGLPAPYPSVGAYVRFPPRWRTVLVPARAAEATALGMTLYPASKPLPLLAQRLLWAAARASGGRALLGARETWTPPMPRAEFAALWEQWCHLAGETVDGLAFYQRLQASRAALTVLLCAGNRSMLIRVRRDAASLRLEREISEAARAARTRTFHVPVLAGSGQAGPWSWTAYAAFAQRPHAPARTAGRELTDEITELVESVLSRPVGVPAHWRGSHGDLTPWNLRRSAGTTWLIDWEDTCWAPPGADQVYFTTVRAALRRGAVVRLPWATELQEAAQYWAERVSGRSIVRAEHSLQRRLETLLGCTGSVQPG